MIGVVDSENGVEVGTMVGPNRQTPRTHMLGRRVHERRGGVRCVPSRWLKECGPPNEPPIEDMRSTTPPRAPLNATSGAGHPQARRMRNYVFSWI